MRKVIDMVTAAVLLMGLGYLIAASAVTLPGGEGPEPLLSFELAMPPFAAAAIRWGTLALAGFGAILLLLSLAKTAPGQRFSIRRYATILVWLAVLLAIYSVARPAAETVTTTTEALQPEAREILTAPDPAGSGWMAGALLAAVVAAVVIRLAFAVKSRFWDLPVPGPVSPHTSPGEPLAPPIAVVLGDDPRSRVINAYASFEQLAREEGVGRLSSETPRRHTRRARAELPIESFDLDVLGDEYEAVRFADAEIVSSDAERAESAWGRIRRKLAP